MQAPLPIPLHIPGTCELPIEVLESGGRIGTLEDIQKQSMRAKKLTMKACVGAYLVMPDGVLPYSAYPFMLHEIFVLPWNIHVVDHQMTIQLIHCMGV